MSKYYPRVVGSRTLIFFSLLLLGLVFIPLESPARAKKKNHSAKADRTVTATAPAKPEAVASQPPFTPVENSVTNGGLTVLARVFTSGGWVKPNGPFPVVLTYQAASTGATGVTVKVTLSDVAVFVQSTPAAASGNGTPASPLVYNIGIVGPNGTGQIAIEARAKTLAEDPEVIWKDASSDISLVAGAQPAKFARSHGPKVTTLETAVYGDRPFPVVMVQYQDVKHCTAVGSPFPECSGNHTAAALDTAINSRTTGKSVWQLYQDESFGQLFVDGKISPVPNSPDTPFTPGYVHKFSTLAPQGTCTGVTLGAVYGTPAYPNRIEGGWYTLPGMQAYYGADGTGHALLGAETGQGLLFGIDNACGPTGKLAYDAASIADPDIDYNDFDIDKDGVVDFFNIVFAGDGGNGSTTPSGINNVWPHSSDLRSYFTDVDGQTGYVSNDQFRNRLNQLVYWTDATRTAQTTTPTAFPVFVRVGRYNVNPEAAIESVSVIAHEYGHSLGLPDYYSTGTRGTMGSYDLNGTDYFQYHSIFSRQDLGWVVPRALPSGTVTMKESKFDTGEIYWNRPDGTPYVLTGQGIHNGDVYRVGLPPKKLVDNVPSGTRAWYSGSGNAFGCAADGGGHNLDFFIPDLVNYGSASAITLKFKHFYEIEWDYDYGFVLVSDDGGSTWTSLASQSGGSTTPGALNPSANSCQTAYGNGITGISDGDSSNDTVKRNTADYTGGQFINDQFDLTPYKGKNIILRFSYATDPGLAKRGWFIDDMEIKADNTVVYSSDFEASDERTRIFPNGWTRVSSADGSPADHAYYIELRDRISNDFDGKGQSERGSPTFEGGLLVMYDDESHGYGNFGVDDPPAITPVDSNPDPGNESPNLDDATFNLTRAEFNACTHIDNYTDPNAADKLWKLPAYLYFKVTGLTGLSAGATLPGSPATLTMITDTQPNCNALSFTPPTLSMGSDYENPDTNGSYTLNWIRPPGATGPDVLQVATNCSPNVIDDAESGLSTAKWDVTTEGTYAGFNWQASNEKPQHSGNTFRAKGADGVTNASAILKYKVKVSIPANGITTLDWEDWFVNEGDDGVFVEVSDDGLTGWTPIFSNGRSELAPDAVTAFANETLTPHHVDLAAYKGKSFYFRFRYFLGPENRAASTPFGWYIDNIALNTSDWSDVATTGGTSFTDHKASGSYCYRVRTNFIVGSSVLPSEFSNIVGADVAPNVVPVVSRRTHGSETFDLDLPATGPIAIEPRAGTHQLVYTFPAAVTVPGTATVSPSGSASTAIGNDNKTVVVTLSGTPSPGHVVVTLNGVVAGGAFSNLLGRMDVLLGDTNGDGSVNSADISQTKSQSGAVIGNGNFREDVNVDGQINSGDISLVKSKSGTALP